MSEIILAGLVIMTASLSGILFTAKFASDFLHRRIEALVSFSAGVFIVTSASLLLEVFHITESLLQTVLLATLGYVAAALLHAFWPETHHHHDDDCEKKRGARKILVGDAIHNIADGIIIVPAFIISSGLGIVVALSVFIHEFLQEISEFFILKHAGFSTRKALLINFLVSSTIFIGIGIGYFALASETLESVLLAVSGGFFIHVVVHDLLPRKHTATHPHRTHLLMVLIGAILMVGINALLADSHAHEGHSDESIETA